VSRAELEDERTFLLRSIEDLDEERAAGDLSDEDHAALRDRYTVRAAEVLRALEARSEVEVPPSAPGPSTTPRPRLRRPRRVLLVTGVIALVAAVSATVVLTQTGVRLPGDTSSGSVSLGRADLLRRTLTQAETLEARGDVAGALRLFHQVLAADPVQVDALAESGWLEFEAGVNARNGTVIAHAQRLEEQAANVDPGAYAPHLYLGSILLAEGDATGAQGQYRLFLAGHPPIAQVRAAASFIDRAFAATGQTPPHLPAVASPGP
jgi:hypothetical protein